MTKFSREIKDIARATVEVAKESDAISELIADLKRFSRERNVDAKTHPIALGAVSALMRRELLPSFDVFLENVIAAAREIANHHDVRVTSANALNAHERAELAQAIEKRLGGSIAVEERTDATLLGGLIVETGGWRFDASVLGKIQRLKRALTV